MYSISFLTCFIKKGASCDIVNIWIEPLMASRHYLLRHMTSLYPPSGRLLINNYIHQYISKR